MSHCSYLIQLPSSYYFRIRVPPPLQSIVGKTEIRYSLRCGSLLEAKPKARLLAGKIQQLFTYKDIMELSQEQIQEIIVKYVQDALNDAEEHRATGKPLSHTQLNNNLFGAVCLLSERREELALCNYKYIAQRVDDVLLESGIEVDKDSDSYNILARELLKAEIKILEIEKKRMYGDYTLSDAEKVFLPQDSQTIIKRPKEKSEKLSKVIEAYKAENIRAKTWSEGTATEYISNLELIADHFGEGTPIHQVDGEKLREFKSLMMKMPKHFRSKKEYEGMSLKQISQLYLPESSRMSVTTLNNKYLGLLSALFNFAQSNSYIDTNPATGLKVKQSKTIKASEERDPFTVKDLNMIFSSKEYREDKHRSSHNFWLPLLALYTGCRLEELSQLHCDDVRKEDDVWVLDINDKDEKHLKNLSSRRLVPLYPFLLELGFHKFAVEQRDEGHTRVFSDLKKVQNKYGHAPSKWFGDYKKRCGIVAEKGKKTFHSFRHTAINCLAQQVINDNVIKSLVGHAKKGETFGRYSKDLKPKVVYGEAVLKLNFEGLDLSHLKDSKYVSD